MRLYELAYTCRLYAAFTDFDKSFTEFLQATNPALDFNTESHGHALMKWLNSWGCRQFAKKSHPLALKNLKEWAQIFVVPLPSTDQSLIDLPQTALNTIAEAYGDLKKRPASTRKSKKVTFGATGAAKVLYAIRPQACPPWDAPIRKKSNYDGSEDSYCRFLIQVQKELSTLKEEVAEFGMRLDQIPSKVGRPESSLPKLVDEYNWVKHTRRCQPPTSEELQQWLVWSTRL